MSKDMQKRIPRLLDPIGQQGEMDLEAPKGDLITRHRLRMALLLEAMKQGLKKRLADTDRQKGEK